MLSGRYKAKDEKATEPSGHAKKNKGSTTKIVSLKIGDIRPQHSLSTVNESTVLPPKSKEVSFTGSPLQVITEQSEQSVSTHQQTPLIDFSALATKPLPSALLDCRKNWANVFDLILDPTKRESNNGIILESVKKTHPKIICHHTQRIMFDPVNYDGETLERELAPSDCAELLFQQNEIHDAIRHALANHRLYEDIQYLPKLMQDAMVLACKKGDVETIRTIYEKNYNFLVTPHYKSKCLPLSHALENEKSFVAILKLLENRKKGLALASLWFPDQSGYLPLELALRGNCSLEMIQNIMAMMGDSLSDFVLKSPIPEHRQSVLNQLLHLSILRGNNMLQAKILSWGGQMDAELMQGKTASQLALAVPVPLDNTTEEKVCLPKYLNPIERNNKAQVLRSLQLREGLFGNKDLKGKQEEVGWFTMHPPAVYLLKHATALANAILADDVEYVSKILKIYPNLLEIKVPLDQLNKRETAKKLPEKMKHLTALQVAYHYSAKPKICQTILDVMPHDMAIEQLGGKTKQRGGLRLANLQDRIKPRSTLHVLSR